MSLFIKLNTFKEKNEALLNSISRINNGQASENTYEVKFKDFHKIPGSPFSYWVNNNIRNLFEEFEVFESETRTAKVGLSTGDDFRFIRNWWETPQPEKDIDSNWITFPKGGSYSPFYLNPPMEVNWGREIKTFPRSVLRNESYYKKEGITWPLRARAFAPQAMPSNSVFSVRGYSVFVEKEDLLVTLAIFNSSIFDYIYKTALGRFGYPEFIVGILQLLPWPKLNETQKEYLGNLAENAWQIKLLPDLANEKSRYYIAPRILLEKNFNIKFELDIEKYKKIRLDIDKYCLGLFNLNDDDVLQRNFDGEFLEPVFNAKEEVFSWCVGVVFGRYNDESHLLVKLPQRTPFEPLPKSADLLDENISKLDVFEDFENCRDGLVHRIKKVLIKHKITLDIDVSKYLAQSFFDRHFTYFSENKRDVALYWPLQSISGNHTLWVYYHRLSSETLYNCVNNFIEPRIDELVKELTTLISENSSEPSEKNKIDKLANQRSDLESFREELLRLAKFWQPNINDGVQVTAAPLWRLFKHKAWQKKLKQTWEQVEYGEYDWAHLAFSTWPERVLKKCHADRSLAIAHDVESDLWHEVEVIKKNKKEPVWEWQPKPFSDAELHGYIKEKIATDERLKLYRSNQANNLNGGKL